MQPGGTGRRRPLGWRALSILAAMMLPGALLVQVAAVGPSRGAATAAPASSAPAVAPRAAASAGTAPWWDGSCDANRWNRLARSVGWTGAGAHALGASYLGVAVCGPRPSVDGSPDVLWGRPGWGESEWQCVELAQRFMALVYGVNAYQANGVDVVAHYTTAQGGGLVRIDNGTAGHAPEPGDIISFQSSSRVGHVTVVASSTVDSHGNGTITMLSQNDSSDGWRTLPVVQWVLQDYGSHHPYGWLHDPLGRGNPLSEGSFVRVTGSSTVYRIVGGAPLAIRTWTPWGHSQPVSVVSASQLARLRPRPADGTYLQTGVGGALYRVAGGAPLALDAADSARIPGWSSRRVMLLDSWAVSRLDHLRALPFDRTELCDATTRSCYLVAGGAPMLVPRADAAAVPGWRASAATWVTSSQLVGRGRLRTTPADGTLLLDLADGVTYRTAGGSPWRYLPTDAPHLPGWRASRVVAVPHAEFAGGAHLRRLPSDGTIVRDIADGSTYVTAGGSALYLGADALARTYPGAAVTPVSGWELTHAVHLVRRPVDGTALAVVPTGALYRVVKGVAVPAAPGASATAAIRVDQSVIDNAGLAGRWSHLASAPPAAPVPGPVQAVTAGRQLRLAWSVPVASSAVTTYDVRLRRATPVQGFSPWIAPGSWQGLRATGVRVGLAAGAVTCLSVRAHNRAGQVGAWSAPRCTTAPVDDRAATSASPGWSPVASPGAYLGTLTRTARHGASLTYSAVVAGRLGLLASVGPQGGSVRVLLGGRLVGTVSLVSATAKDGQLLMLAPFAPRAGNLVLVVSSNTGREVRLDGVVIART